MRVVDAREAEPAVSGLVQAGTARRARAASRRAAGAAAGVPSASTNAYDADSRHAFMIAVPTFWPSPVRARWYSASMMLIAVEVAVAEVAHRRAEERTTAVGAPAVFPLLPTERGAGLVGARQPLRAAGLVEAEALAVDDARVDAPAATRSRCRASRACRSACCARRRRPSSPARAAARGRAAS